MRNRKVDANPSSSKPERAKAPPYSTTADDPSSSARSPFSTFRNERAGELARPTQPAAGRIDASLAIGARRDDDDSRRVPSVLDSPIGIGGIGNVVVVALLRSPGAACVIAVLPSIPPIAVGTVGSQRRSLSIACEAMKRPN